MGVRRKHQFIASLPSEACLISRRVWRGCGQVFGLAGKTYRCMIGVSTNPSSRFGENQCVWAFVPAYRCGAVPDSHRIPSWRPPENATSKRAARYSAAPRLSTKYCGYARVHAQPRELNLRRPRSLRAIKMRTSSPLALGAAALTIVPKSGLPMVPSAGTQSGRAQFVLTNPDKSTYTLEAEFNVK